MIRRLRQRYPCLGLVALSDDEFPEVTRALLAAGADRVVLGSAVAEVLLAVAQDLVGEPGERERGTA